MTPESLAPKSCRAMRSIQGQWRRVTVMSICRGGSLASSPQKQRAVAKPPSKFQRWCAPSLSTGHPERSKTVREAGCLTQSKDPAEPIPPVQRQGVGCQAYRCALCKLRKSAKPEPIQLCSKQSDCGCPNFGVAVQLAYHELDYWSAEHIDPVLRAGADFAVGSVPKAANGAQGPHAGINQDGTEATATPSARRIRKTLTWTQHTALMSTCASCGRRCNLCPNIAPKLH